MKALCMNEIDEVSGGIVWLAAAGELFTAVANASAALSGMMAITPPGSTGDFSGGMASIQGA